MTTKQRDQVMPAILAGSTIALLLGIGGFILNHTQRPGHPVMEERVSYIQASLIDIQNSLDRIERRIVDPN